MIPFERCYFKINLTDTETEIIWKEGYIEFYVSIAGVEISSSPGKFDGSLFLFQLNYLIGWYKQ